MNFKRIIITLLAAASIVCSCKDPDNTTSSKYLKGTLTFNSRMYLEAGSDYTFVPTGLTHPEEGKGIGIYWRVSPNSNREDKADTTLLATEGKGVSEGRFTFHFGEGTGDRSLKVAELTNYTVNCYAYSPGYTYTVAAKSVTLVKKGYGADCSLTESGIDPNSDNAFVDTRDSKVYYTSTIGQLEWYKNNNSYYTDGSETLEMANYLNEPAMGDILGGFYTFESAKKACPEGWRLPSEADWTTTAKILANDSSLSEGKEWKNAAGAFLCKAKFNGKLLWEFWPDVKVPSSPRFCALPAGFCNGFEKVEQSKLLPDDTTPYYGEGFNGVQEYAAFWTSTEDPADSAKAYYRYFILGDPTVHIGTAYKDSFGISVRCCRNK